MKLTQDQVLSEAISMATRGHRVAVFSYDQKHADYLTCAAVACTGVEVKRIHNTTLRFASGGCLRFLSNSNPKSEQDVRGMQGPVFNLVVASFGADQWELNRLYWFDENSIRFKPVQIRTRFERILADED
jgi:hypothetical protein